MKKTLLIIASLVLLWYGYGYFSLGSTKIPAQDFSISKGDTFNSLPQKLNLDINQTLYKLWLKSHTDGLTLQLGSYHVSEGSTLTSLFDKTLKNPQSKDITITILPGWNIYDIDAYLADHSITKYEQFVKTTQDILPELQKKYAFLKETKSLEWFLYPDTYRIRPESSASDIIHILLDQFDKIIIAKTDVPADKLYDLLILASIVEREEKISENKRVVAGILWKRLREGIAIGADATVCYPYKLTQKECTPAFINEHIYEKSEYNTRSMRGLPPTPISNVSEDTFGATAEPQSSPYYYYLHDDNGEIHYADSLAGHNANKVKYLGK